MHPTSARRKKDILEKHAVLWGNITWVEMGKQNTQAEKVYWTVLYVSYATVIL